MSRTRPTRLPLPSGLGVLYDPRSPPRVSTELKPDTGSPLPIPPEGVHTFHGTTTEWGLPVEGMGYRDCVTPKIRFVDFPQIFFSSDTMPVITWGDIPKRSESSETSSGVDVDLCLDFILHRLYGPTLRPPVVGHVPFETSGFRRSHQIYHQVYQRYISDSTYISFTL